MKIVFAGIILFVSWAQGGWDDRMLKLLQEEPSLSEEARFSRVADSYLTPVGLTPEGCTDIPQVSSQLPDWTSRFPRNPAILSLAGCVYSTIPLLRGSGLSLLSKAMLESGCDRTQWQKRAPLFLTLAARILDEFSRESQPGQTPLSISASLLIRSLAQWYMGHEQAAVSAEATRIRCRMEEANVLNLFRVFHRHKEEIPGLYDAGVAALFPLLGSSRPGKNTTFFQILNQQGHHSLYLVLGQYLAEGMTRPQALRALASIERLLPNPDDCRFFEGAGILGLLRRGHEEQRAAQWIEGRLPRLLVSEEVYTGLELLTAGLWYKDQSLKTARLSDAWRAAKTSELRIIERLNENPELTGISYHMAGFTAWHQHILEELEQSTDQVWMVPQERVLTWLNSNWKVVCEMHDEAERQRITARDATQRKKELPKEPPREEVPAAQLAASLTFKEAAPAPHAPPQVKVKVKTKGAARPPQVQGAVAAAQEKRPRPKITDYLDVTSNTYKIFERLFASTDGSVRDEGVKISMDEVGQLMQALNQKYDSSGGKGSHTKITMSFSGIAEPQEEMITLSKTTRLNAAQIKDIRERFIKFGLWPRRCEDWIRRTHPETRE